jgi:hypothetical protein
LMAAWRQCRRCVRRSPSPSRRGHGGVHDDLPGVLAGPALGLACGRPCQGSSRCSGDGIRRSAVRPSDRSVDYYARATGRSIRALLAIASSTPPAHRLDD